MILLAVAGCTCCRGTAKLEIPSLQAELDAKKAAFAAEAPEELKKTFADGVEEVARSGVLERALKAGDEAPDFTLSNAIGEQVTLSTLLEDGPVVLTWYRGGWCPYCNIQLHALQAALSKVHEFNGQLVAISPELPDRALDTAQKNALAFEVLSDAGNNVARTYGIVYRLPDPVAEAFKAHIDLEAYNGDASQELPLAVTYIVDQNRIIQFAFVDADYTKRAEPAKILDVLRELAAKQ